MLGYIKRNLSIRATAHYLHMNISNTTHWFTVTTHYNGLNVTTVKTFLVRIFWICTVYTQIHTSYGLLFIHI